MPKKETASKVLQRLIASNEFSKSDIDQQFLKFLVQYSVNGTIPTESEIAIDFFKKGKAFDSAQDSTVRTHIYLLRKKLDHYYLGEGNNDKTRLVIPKGRYEVKFVENTKPIIPSLRRMALLITVVFLLLVISTLILKISPGYFLATRTISKEDHIWADFFKSDLETVLILGDYFVFVEQNYNNDGYHRIRSGQVNSLTDLKAYYSNHPQYQTRFIDETHTYLAPNVAQSALSITNICAKNGLVLSHLMASEKSFSDLKHKNLVFVGPLETLRSFNHGINANHISWQFQPDQINISSPSDTSSHKKYNISIDENDRFRRNFGIVFKLPGQSGNTLLYITGFSPNTLPIMTDLLMNGQFSKRVKVLFTDENQNLPKFFEALVEFTSIGSESSYKIIKFFPLE